MRRLLSLLIILAVLGCGLHLGEAVASHDEAVPHHFALDEHMSADHDEGSPDISVDAGHHHCPIAPEPHQAAIGCTAAPAMLLVARPVVAMASLGQAPPVEPPSA